jgi:hypothetical protein
MEFMAAAHPWPGGQYYDHNFVDKNGVLLKTNATINLKKLQVFERKNTQFIAKLFGHNEVRNLCRRGRGEK